MKRGEKKKPIDKRIVDFLNDWNNNPDGEENAMVPINHFWLSARDVSEIFVLKWYVSKEDFNHLKNVIQWEGDKNKIFLEMEENIVEIEVDNQGMIKKYYSDNKESFDKIDEMFKDLL